LGYKQVVTTWLKVKNLHISRSGADPVVDKLARKSSKALIRIPYPDKKVVENNSE
jgi:hypothetical protein